MYRSSNEHELLDMLGVTVHGVGMSDAAAEKQVGGVLNDVAKAADNGGEASKKFLDAVKTAHNTEIFVTKDNCVAYHDGFTGNVKINPDISALYRRYPEGDFRGKIENFDGILIHEISHGLPKLDFPEVTSESNGAKWNAPTWKENAAPIESGQFGRDVAIGHGLTGMARSLVGLEQFRNEAREELRAVRITNAVMSEVREDYKPRLYYDNPGMSKPQCDTPDGGRVPMQESGIKTEIPIRLKHLGGHLFNNSDKPADEQDSNKQQKGEEVKERSRQHSDSGTNHINGASDKNAMLSNLGKVAADYVLAIVGDDPARPQAAAETIRTRIAENQATVTTKGETYSVERVEKIADTDRSNVTQTNTRSA